MAVNISTIICMLMCVVGVADGWGYRTTSAPHHHRYSSLSNRLRALEGRVHVLHRQSQRNVRYNGWVSREQASLMKRLTENVANISQALGEEIHMMRQIAIENRDTSHEIHELYMRHRRVHWSIGKLWKYIRTLWERDMGTALPPTRRPHRWTTRQRTTGGWGPKPHTTPGPSGPIQIRFPHPQRGTTYANGGIVSYISGHVEIFRYGQWGSICDDYFDDRDAAVICRTGGYSGGEYRNGNYKQRLPGRPDRIWLDDLACRGWERSILACHHVRWGRHNCGHSEDVGIMCYIGTPQPTGRPHPRPTTEAANPVTSAWDCRANGRYSCDNGRKCISRGWICDGYFDCRDRSDERNCHTTGGPNPTTASWRSRTTEDSNPVTSAMDCRANGRYSCDNETKCISRGWICDGYSDCQDRSDERNCHTTGGPTAGPTTASWRSQTNESNPVRVAYGVSPGFCYHKCGSSYGLCESVCGEGNLCCKYGYYGRGCTAELKNLARNGSRCVGYKYSNTRRG